MAEQTKMQMAYRLIRSKITSGAFRPGERLNISELAAQAGMSIIPVREAIKQLQIEGLVESDTYRGVRVVSYSQKELQELYLIRSELEGLAGRLAAEHNSEAGVAKLAKILDDPNKSVSRANTDFHRQIYKMADSERLLNLITNVWDTTYLINKGLALHHVEGQKERSAIEHREILEAIKNGEPERTDQLIRQHILDAGQRVMDWIGKNEPRKKK